MRLHLGEMVDYYGEEDGVTFFRKHLKRYLEPFAFTQALLPEMVVATAQGELERLLTESEGVMVVG
jgi:tRNA-dihydrouridine synthase